MRIPIHGDWRDVGLRELFYAYRKAKADCFFERSLYLAQSFAQYEINLGENLLQLRQRLHDGEIDEILAANLGEPRIVGKKLTTRPADTNEPHSYFSDPVRAFERLKAGNQLSPEFRLVGEFPVVAHVISALWINEIGHKFDAVLPSNAFGSRLRRYRRHDAPKSDANYHLTGIGSFEPYYEPYKTWRRSGLDAINSEIKGGQAVIALSLDFTNYYHNVDPKFISNAEFQREIGIELDAWEKTFTESISHFLSLWGKKTIEKMESFGAATLGISHGGLPIGISAVRVISNVLLSQLDKAICFSLSPIYYGRYVDDIFLVLRDNGSLEDASGVWKYISEHCKFFIAPSDKKEPVRFSAPSSWGRTNLVLQQSKQKLFFLSGQAGSDLLSSIDAELRSVSSERRLMPSVDGLADMASAHVLTAAGQASEEADTLRRADGLSVKRLGWAVQLRSVEILARNLRREDWEKERKEFYEFARLHIVRPDKILEHFDYLPRLISIAVALRDWSDAKRIVEGAIGAIDDVERIGPREGKINGVEFLVTSSAWDELRASLKAMCADAVVRSIAWNANSREPYSLTRTGQRLCSLLELGNQEDVLAAALAIREGDWAKTAYKDHIRRDAGRQRPITDEEGGLRESYDYVEALTSFLSESSGKEHDVQAPRIRPDIRVENASSVSLLPYLFPTRPYTTREIALFLPEKCVVGGADESPVVWAEYVRAVRGAWVKIPDPQPERAGSGGPIDEEEGDPPPYAVVGTEPRRQEVLIGVSSLETTDDTWNTTASGRTANSRDRWKRIRRIVNLAVKAHPKPTYLLLPELSLPERWIPTVSGILADARINLIAGLDYQATQTGTVHSSAVLVLEDDRLGFTSWIELRQPKTQPAPAEERDLLQLYDKSWTTFGSSEHKAVYVHFGFCFGVLVCSELQNIAYRKSFQGEVDALMIPSWNKDVETFASLVESASLDVHAFIALVNNRRFGDSRVRAPGKLIFERDLCRLRGGLNEHLVVVKLEIDALRRFQSRAKRWPEDDDPFKPVPENFRPSKRRRTRPR